MASSAWTIIYENRTFSILSPCHQSQGQSRPLSQTTNITVPLIWGTPLLCLARQVGKWALYIEHEVSERRNEEGKTSLLYLIDVQEDTQTQGKPDQKGTDKDSYSILILFPGVYRHDRDGNAHPIQRRGLFSSRSSCPFPHSFKHSGSALIRNTHSNVQ